ncbi:MAG: methionine biosynthesis protein MetW [Candidatus Omnitrophica bacterium]|nr:methionine biosynthesis protein MetW [Candidatus Omnitrophota bacterium]MCF7878888.1 methionine biosynthesis protein MetW [Candidatus Omnitrophota bacterium]MCF7895613.1 methionine biosynthesis protein MetW [Candidatus Omnitrophota bacterium]MCF7897306.1 methionine biosynthesis protein MetW [Candidatus Omnitrophota bacterium]MCF7909341.1 methionine biosynthesis protein MetW [Candidatus Omnitrophota bacterium]
MKSKRIDYRIIYRIIKPKSRVLDLGCGDGELLSFLVKEKKVKAQGIELNEAAIYNCVEKGLSVFHGNIETGLSGYPDNAFDYVILNQSMQEVKDVEHVVDEALRIGKKVIVGFPNFAQLKARSRLFLKGKVPITSSLPYRWYNTPNLHFLSIIDFKDFCREKNIKILKKFYLSKNKVIKILPNLLALNAIFLIKK